MVRIVARGSRREQANPRQLGILQKGQGKFFLLPWGKIEEENGCGFLPPRDVSQFQDDGDNYA
jgi:hypothetical protein